MKDKIKYRISIIGSLLKYVNGSQLFLLLNFAAGLILLAVSFINPAIYKIFIDDVILSRSSAGIYDVVICYMVVFLIKTAVLYIKKYASNKLFYRVIFRVKFNIWRRYLNIPFHEYENLNIGDIKMKLEDDTSRIEMFMENQSINYFISYITLIVSAVILFFINWKMALFSIAVIPLTFYFDHAISKKEKILNENNRENDQNMTGWLHSSINGWREIKALNLQLYHKRKFVGYIRKYAVYFSKWINYWVIRSLIIPKIKDDFIMKFFIYFIGGILIMRGDLKISGMLLFIMYYNILCSSINSVSSADAELQASSPYIDKFIGELRELTRERSLTAKRDEVPALERIDFSNVCFSYPDNEVLKNISFTFFRGDRIALTGKSGCGKTTLLKLMTGMLIPSSGSICFSEKDINDFSINDLHKKIGFIMQENKLFNTTVRDNLLYSCPGASDGDIEQACRRAYIFDFIETLPDKFETVIGEGGVKLSGGQKQRLALARLFLRDVDVYIFDEATSAVDPYSEQFINDAIQNIGKGKIIIISSHRDSSVRYCSRVINLDSGRVDLAVQS